MLKRPPNGPYLEDDGADPDAHEVRKGDVLMEPGAWAKDSGMYSRSPRNGQIPVCMDGQLIGKIAAGANVAVNCRDVSKEVGAVLAGNVRKRDVLDPNLVRPGVYQALSRLKTHIDASLDSFFASNSLGDFFSGNIGMRVMLPEDKFQGIGLDDHYRDFPNLEDLFEIVSKPDEYANVSAQQYLDSSRIKWLMALKLRLEQYVRNYVDTHVSAYSCFYQKFSADVSFNVIYLPKMVTAWDYDADPDKKGGGGLKMKAYFLRSDAKEFILRGLKFKA